MTRTFKAACLAMILAVYAPAMAGATSRIKDLANIEGVRQNQLIGYGLVVGLNGTGDTLNNIPFTKQSLTAMLERLGVNIRGQTIRTGNVAAVMVTANLPAFGTQGTRIDVTVSALGDAKSLQGGTLLVTPLLGADGNVYAVAQGSLAIGGFQAEGDAAKITRGVPTVGRIANGALIERDTGAINPLCRTRLFAHGRRTARAVVLFHGFTNCPRQFEALGRLLHERGDNVLIPRQPRHGLADRMSEDLAALTAPELAALAVAAAAVLCVVALTGTSRWVPDTETSGVAATQVAYVVPASWAGR